MAKFGYFHTGYDEPQAVYEGDFMEMEKEFVRILKYGTIHQPKGELLAAIRLEKGYDVRKISE